MYMKRQKGKNHLKNRERKKIRKKKKSSFSVLVPCMFLETLVGVISREVKQGSIFLHNCAEVTPPINTPT